MTRCSAFTLESSTLSGEVRRKKSTAADLNADNMAVYHESHETTTKPQEWTTMFNGKIPVLKDAASSHHEPAKTTPEDETIIYGELPRTSVLMELQDRVGVLHDVLRYFWKVRAEHVVPVSKRLNSYLPCACPSSSSTM